MSVWNNLLSLQVALFACSILLSGLVFMPVSQVTLGFKGQCLLFADIKLEWNSNETVSVDLSKTQYGSISDCDVPTFIPVSVAIGCIIFSWFYFFNLVFTSVETTASTYRAQVPALLVFASLFISTIVAASKISGGFDALCNSIVKNKPSEDRTLHCSEFDELEWTQNINPYQFYTRYVIAEVSCWILCAILFLLCCVISTGVYQMLQAHVGIEHIKATFIATLSECLAGSEVNLVDGNGTAPQTSDQDYASSLDRQKDQRAGADVTVHEQLESGLTESGGYNGNS